jgi:hypothetical protein
MQQLKYASSAFVGSDTEMPYVLNYNYPYKTKMNPLIIEFFFRNKATPNNFFIKCYRY